MEESACFLATLKLVQDQTDSSTYKQTGSYSVMLYSGWTKRLLNIKGYTGKYFHIKCGLMMMMMKSELYQQ